MENSEPKDINTLRGHLFKTIEGLQAGTLSIEMAKAISDVSQTLINTAKVEVELSKATGQKPSGFIGDVLTLKPGTTVHRIS